MDETLRALEERAKEYRKDPVDIAMLKASRERLEEYKKDREAQRALNAKVVPSTLARFEVGADSIERLRTRVKAISENPLSEPHTIWNAQNFLEQVEAAMEAQAVLQELRSTPLLEAVSREECMEILRRFEADHKDTTEPHE